MIFSEKRYLCVVEISSNEEKRIAIDRLAPALLECPSNVIYCEKEGKLYGIISTGDIHRAKTKGENVVEINTTFTFLSGSEHMRAREIFLAKPNINALPVVGDGWRLVGAYTRWDDALWGYEFDFLKDNKYADAVWKRYRRIAIVMPSIQVLWKTELVKRWGDFFRERGSTVEVISKSDIVEAFNSMDMVFFADEDELRGLGTLYKDVLGKEFRWAQAKTLGSLAADMGKVAENAIGETVLRELMNRGVYVITLRISRNGTVYWKNVECEIDQKFKTIGTEKNSTYVHKEFWEEFYDDAYDMAYVSEVGMQGYPQIIKDGNRKLKDVEGKYYNVINGERLTVGQPETYNNSIYFFGPCWVTGWRTGDAYTMESRLQEILNASGMSNRVVNCGCWSDEFLRLLRICSTKFKCGDVVMLYAGGKTFQGIPTINLAECLERENIPARWYWDSEAHPNHKVFKLWAEEIYKYIPKYLLKQKAVEEIRMEDEKFSLLTASYFGSYFHGFEADGTIGAIVMNCNPFTYGHRFLIEEACKTVDRLIIFVVEEDKSLFSFKERFAMVAEGTKDLEQVTVAPSGSFILSRQTFPEYFQKEEDENLTQNVEFDIELFAEAIAPRLNIKYRFVGEEKNDPVTWAYNQAMKKILPLHGIELIEIPRKTMAGKTDPISATLVREKLAEGDWEGIKNIVPQSTVDILAVSWCK